MGGVRIVPDLTLDELDPVGSAMLIMPGAELWDSGGNREFAVAAQGFLDVGKPVAAICGATFGLADAGMLDDREHTSGGLEYLKLSANYRGEKHYKDVPAHTDGLLITASPTSPVEFAREIFTTLDLYPPDTLDAWYGLYSTGDAKYFYALMAG
jgi:putative intracellular protease/amidase